MKKFLVINKKFKFKHRDPGRDVLEGGGDQEGQGERVPLPEDGGRAGKRVRPGEARGVLLQEQAVHQIVRPRQKVCNFFLLHCL